MTTPRSQLIREKYAILDKYNQLQMRQNIAGTAMDFLSKYIAEEENKRRDEANLQHQTYLENEATKRTGLEEKQYGVAVEEQKANRASRQSQETYQQEEKKLNAEERIAERELKKTYYENSAVGKTKFYKMADKNGNPTIVKIDIDGTATPIYTGKKDDRLPINSEIISDYFMLKDSPNPDDIKRCKEYEKLWPALKGVQTEQTAEQVDSRGSLQNAQPVKDWSKRKVK